MIFLKNLANSSFVISYFIVSLIFFIIVCFNKCTLLVNLYPQFSPGDNHQSMVCQVVKSTHFREMNISAETLEFVISLKSLNMRHAWGTIKICNKYLLQFLISVVASEWWTLNAVACSLHRLATSLLHNIKVGV